MLTMPQPRPMPSIGRGCHAEAEFIEMKLALAENLRARRLERHLNQTQVARIIGSSPSTVAKMEAADPNVLLRELAARPDS